MSVYVLILQLQGRTSYVFKKKGFFRILFLNQPKPQHKLPTEFMVI